MWHILPIHGLLLAHNLILLASQSKGHEIGVVYLHVGLLYRPTHLILLTSQPKGHEIDMA
jgi:hypothetical protein